MPNPRLPCLWFDMDIHVHVYIIRNSAADDFGIVCAIHAYLDIILGCIVYKLSGNFGGKLNLAVWRISQPATKLKSANLVLNHSYILCTWRWSHIAKQIGGCGLCTNLVSGIIHLNHFYRVLILQGSFSISQDNLSPMVGVQILWFLCTGLRSTPGPYNLASHSPQRSQEGMRMHAADSGRD